MSDISVQTASNIGRITISTPNPNLDGTGPITTLITGGADGTYVDTIIISAQVMTSQGMVRLFLNDGTNNFLLQEVMIPANVPTSVVPAFSATIGAAMHLQTGYSLGVSTQASDIFSVIATGVNYTNCSC